MKRTALLAMIFVLAGCGDGEEAQSSTSEPASAQEIQLGEAFELRDVKYVEGWDLPTNTGAFAVSGLKVTNVGPDDLIDVNVKLWQGDKDVATANCVSSNIPPEGDTYELTCASADPLPETYDKITIQ